MSNEQDSATGVAAYGRLHQISSSTVSPETLTTSRKISQQILQSLDDKTATAVALELGVAPSTITRWRDEQMPQLAMFLAAAGLKVVPREAVIYLPAPDIAPPPDAMFYAKAQGFD